MTIRKKFKIDLYECTIEFVVTDNTNKELISWHKKKKKDFIDYGSIEGMVISADWNYTVIIKEDCLTHNTISHELNHLSQRICKERGILEEEAQSWLIDHLSHQFYKWIDSKNYSINERDYSRLLYEFKEVLKEIINSKLPRQKMNENLGLILKKLNKK